MDTLDAYLSPLHRRSGRHAAGRGRCRSRPRRLQAVLTEVPGVVSVDELVLFAVDLRNGRRLGEAVQSLHLDERSLFLSFSTRRSSSERPGAEQHHRVAGGHGGPSGRAARLRRRLADRARCRSGCRPTRTLVAFVSIFEEVASTLRAGADSVSHAADVDVTSPEMVRYLGSWVGALALHADRCPPPDSARSSRRPARPSVGAARPSAIHTVLAALTGGEVEIDDDGGVFREGHAPRSSGSGRRARRDDRPPAATRSWSSCCCRWSRRT